MTEAICKEGEINPNLATMVMNNNSTWIHVRHRKRSFLFTGDTVKKNKFVGYEMVERELKRIPKDKVREIAAQNIEAIKASNRRDFRF